MCLGRARRVGTSGRAGVFTYDTTKHENSVFGLNMGCRGGVRILLEPLASAREYLETFDFSRRARVRQFAATLIAANGDDSLIETFERTNSPLVAAAYEMTVGVPALFSRELFVGLLQIEGDKGAKDLIVRHLASAETVAMPEASIDVDTPEDFARLSR